MVEKYFYLQKNTKEEVVVFILSQIKAGELNISVTVQDYEDWITIRVYKDGFEMSCEVCRNNNVVVDEWLCDDVEALQKSDIEWFVRKI